MNDRQKNQSPEPQAGKIRPALRAFSRKAHDIDQAVAPAGILDCAVGCNALGSSPRLVRAANEYSWTTLSVYPETSYSALKERICAYWSGHARVGLANVKVANGSIVILSQLNKLFLEPGVKALGYVPQFKDYMEEVTILGGRYQAIALDPAEGFRFSLPRFLEALDRDEFAVAYLDNPSNPTGQYIDLDAIEAIAAQCARRDVTVIVDEAFGDYLDEDDSAINLLGRYPNIVVTRTFSKGMGIAEFRIGYALMSAELGRYYDRVDPPFQLSAIAAFLAETALDDRDFIRMNRQRVEVEKALLTGELLNRGYTIAETHSSCPIFLLGHRDSEVDLRDRLLRQGIRTIGGADYDNLGSNYVRVNTPARAEEFLSRLIASS